MFSVDYSLNRINAIVEEIERLRQLEFPYKSSKDALEIFGKKFKDNQRVLIQLKTADPPPSDLVSSNACKISLTDIYLYLPIIGFILHSTDVKNAFETYGPLLRLFRKLLQENAKLILSSEWDHSPFVYPQLPILPDFVLIGLPAQESKIRFFCHYPAMK